LSFNIKQSYKRFVLITLALSLLVAIGISSSSCQSSNSSSAQPETLTIGSAFPASWQFYIAQDQNFFAQNGLNFSNKTYDSSLAALNGFLNGEVDLTVNGDYQLVLQAFAKQNISILASIDKSSVIRLIGRKDKGIEKVTDLKGKRVGVILNSQFQFFLTRFLALQGMDYKDIVPVNVSLAQSTEALIKGDVDAVMTVAPSIGQIQAQLGDNISIWEVQSSQPAFNIILARNDWIAQHPETIKKLLKAIDQADNYSIEHPDEAKAIIRKNIQVNEASIDALWPQHQLTISLEQSMIVAMQDEARWMIDNNLTQEKQMPNFLNYIYFDGLKAVKPKAIDIIR
jgi:ABC-type nitrate/sulfonate/bicarbonate transport system substrate-binding protein